MKIFSFGLVQAQAYSLVGAYVIGLIGCTSECFAQPKSESLLLSSVSSKVIVPPPQKNHYPLALRGGQVDEYHSIWVHDAYRWLEDPKASSTQTWLKEEEDFTNTYFNKLLFKRAIQEQLKQLWNYERYSTPFREGKFLFYLKNDGKQNHSVFYRTSALKRGSASGKGIVLGKEDALVLDPNTFSSDGTWAVNSYEVSPDGVWLVYSVSEAGSDWLTWHIRNVMTGKELPELIRFTKGTPIAFSREGQGFFYARYKAPRPGEELHQQNSHQSIYYHTFGQDQSQDKLIFERRDQPLWILSPSVSEDGHYLFVTIYLGTENRNLLYYKDLKTGRIDDGYLIPIVKEFEAEYTVIGNQGPQILVKTTSKADRGRIIRISLEQPQQRELPLQTELSIQGAPPQQAESSLQKKQPQQRELPQAHRVEIIPEMEDIIEEARFLDQKILVSYLHNAHNQVNIYDLQGKLIRQLKLPGIGSVYGFTGHEKDTETYYTFTNFHTPPQIYRYHLRTGKNTMIFQPQFALQPDQYTTTQVFYPSKDGTQIPMFLTHKKGLVLDGKNPVYLHGYGGFGISKTPSFDPLMLLWIHRGGVYAVPNIRGGGEYGEMWHEAGKKQKKQNVFDDFMAAADWLIDHKYTSSPKLAIQGASNGGLLTGACMTQRPKLFGAVIVKVGVLDMLRFHQFTGGHYWIPEYGTVEDPKEFAALYAYSPLHRIKEGTEYPATLIKTADHDDRVVPAHSYKFAAALQAAQAGNAPILISVEKKAGHGAGMPAEKRIQSIAEEFAFLVQELHLAWPRDLLGP